MNFQLDKKKTRSYLKTITILVSNLVEKGNHRYESKEISFELEQKILNNQDTLINKSTYYKNLQKYDISFHDFHFTSGRDKFEGKIKSRISKKEAKLQISEILNYKREAITDYYLKKTRSKNDFKYYYWKFE
jgi:hypothetical protein